MFFGQVETNGDFDLREKIRLLEEENNRLKELIEVDGLTGLLNLRGWRERTDQLVEVLQRSGGKGGMLALVRIDADEFKEINDGFGHAVGDTVLMGLARIINDVFGRDNDLKARVGGDEFALMFLVNSEPDMRRMTDIFRQKVGETGFGQARITVSVGYTAIGVDELSQYWCNEPARWLVGEMDKIADEAAYMSKKNGRDRVTSG